MSVALPNFAMILQSFSMIRLRCTMVCTSFKDYTHMSSRASRRSATSCFIVLNPIQLKKRTLPVTGLNNYLDQNTQNFFVSCMYPSYFSPNFARSCSSSNVALNASTTVKPSANKALVESCETAAMPTLVRMRPV